jgi:signal transduction histidine kinase
MHYVTTQDHVLHNIQTELHYIPLILGAVIFGLRGAILTFILITALYLPHFVSTWDDPMLSILNRIVHITLSGLIACLAGYLVDREKKYRMQSERDRYLAGIGQAATAIVHDLKNPLMSIQGFARRIYEGKGDIHTSAQMVLSSSKKMQRIIHDVLDFAKPVRLQSANEDIDIIIKSAIESCKIKAEDRKITLTSYLSFEPIKLVVDGSHIERTLINIINNAIDASESGQTVSIRTNRNSDAFTISIKDNGAGMDAETMENIFNPFFTKKHSGTGVGMAIAKKIIEAHQGAIHVSSRESSGTEVMIVLPYMKKKM